MSSKPVQTYYPNTWGAMLKYGVLAAVGGVLLSFIFSLRSGISLRGMLTGALIGVTCFGMSIILELLFHRPLDRLPMGMQKFLRGIMYAVGGMVGFYLAFGIASVTIWGQKSPQFPPGMGSSML